MSDAFEKFLGDAIDRAVAGHLDATHSKLAAMSKTDREAYMEANGMYHGPHFDPTFAEDPAQWWIDYRAGKKPHAVDPFEA